MEIKNIWQIFKNWDDSDEMCQCNVSKKKQAGPWTFVSKIMVKMWTKNRPPFTVELRRRKFLKSQETSRKSDINYIPTENMWQ
jgi:hypothetical protein